MSILADLGTIAAMWIPAVAAAVVLLLTVTGGIKRPAPSSGTHLAAVALAALATSAWLLLRVDETRTAFSGAVVVDGVAVLFGLAAVVGAFIAVLLAMAYLEEHQLSAGEWLGLVLLSTTGMLMLAMAGDLIVLFIGIETMSLAVYVLAGYRRASRKAQEAALKYFVYGAFASGFALFGIALLYGEVGRLSGTPGIGFAAMAKAFAPMTLSPLGWVGIAMVLGGLAFKVAAVPFHMWAPDVYEGAPTPSTGFMAVGVKAAAFAGLCRFVATTLLPGSGGTETAVLAIELVAVITMVVGNLVAIRQTQIKRMLAYSSIAHAGYILVGVAAFIDKPDAGLIEAIAYYLLGYTAMTLGAFGVVLAFERKDDRRQDLPIDRLTGMAHRYPGLGLAMAVFMFALAGVPPTAGFFGKLALFSGAVSAGRVAAVVIAVLASAVGAFYYLRVTVVMYMRATDTEEQRVKSAWLSAGLWACVGLTLLIGILPESYFVFARRVLAGWLG
jgi:NADH-quinone oxidoreductase subunit N